MEPSTFPTRTVTNTVVRYEFPRSFETVSVNIPSETLLSDARLRQDAVIGTQIRAIFFRYYRLTIVETEKGGKTVELSREAEPLSGRCYIEGIEISFEELAKNLSDERIDLMVKGGAIRAVMRNDGVFAALMPGDKVVATE